MLPHAATMSEQELCLRAVLHRVTQKHTVQNAESLSASQITELLWDITIRHIIAQLTSAQDVRQHVAAEQVIPPRMVLFYRVLPVQMQEL